MKKKVAIFLTAALAAGTVAGCTKKGSDTAKFTYWVPLYSHVAQFANSFNDVEFYQKLQEKTGVEIEFVHPPAGQESENLNLMLASNDMTDFIETNFLNYKGGPSQAINEGILVDLTESIEKYAPNLKKILEDNPEWDKQVKMDNGGYYCFPFLRGDDYLLSWTGPQIRMDLLEKYHLELPETIDEWDNVLRTFKKNGVEIPLTMPSAKFAAHSMFVGAYGVTSGLYVDNGKVKFGEMQDGYKEFIKLLAGWYKDGILDADFFAHDSKAFNAKIVNGSTGAWVGSAGGNMGTFIPALKELDPKVKLSGTKFPVLNKGDIPQFGHKDWNYTPLNSVSVTTNCKDLKKAAEFFDYGYSDEGHMFYNFGEEGVSYDMIDGYPTYTKKVTEDEDGLPLMNSMSKYMASAYGGPFVQDKRYYEQYLQYPEQKEAISLWVQHESKHRLPPITYTLEESTEFNKLYVNIDTYINENILKFITGGADMAEYDGFVEQLKKMGIERVVSITQTAYDRYMQR